MIIKDSGPESRHIYVTDASAGRIAAYTHDATGYSTAVRVYKDGAPGLEPGPSIGSEEFNAIWATAASRGTHPARCPTLESCLTRLDRISLPRPNWNGHGAMEISAEAIAAARSMLQRLERLAVQPYVFPTVRGGVRLEWGVDVSLALEVEVGGDDAGKWGYLFMIEGEDGVKLDEEGIVEADEVPGLVFRWMAALGATT